MLIAWGLPPCRGSGVYRALAIARELAVQGADVVALTATRETFVTLYGADTDLEAHLPRSAELERVPFFPERLWPLVNNWPRARVDEPRVWARGLLERDYRTFPEEVYASWRAPATTAAVELGLRSDIDLVLATGNPYVDFDVAFTMHEVLDVPFVLDDRDSFLFDVFTGEPGRLYEQRIDRYHQYLDACVEYWCVNPAIASGHRHQHPAGAPKVQVVENGWDAEFLRVGQSRTGERHLRLGFVGTITSGFPVAQLLQAWGSARADGLDGAELHFYGNVGFTQGLRSPVACALEQAAENGVVLHGPVSKVDISDAYSEVDALLFVKEGGQLITSGKVYEYMATGLPIAALGSEGLDSSRVLSGYPRLHTGPLGRHGGRAIREALRDSLEATDATIHAARRHGARFERSNQLRPAIERVMRRGK